MNVIDAMNEIKEVAVKNNNRITEHKTRQVSLEVGELYRQGDIYVFRVKDDHPVGKEVHRHQLADGVSLGARHMLVGDFKMYEGSQYPLKIGELHKKANCLGYAFDVLTAGAINTHPEHDNFKIMKVGRYQVTHQLDLMTLKRVAD